MNLNSLSSLLQFFESDCFIAYIDLLFKARFLHCQVRLNLFQFVKSLLLDDLICSVAYIFEVVQSTNLLLLIAKMQLSLFCSDHFALLKLGRWSHRRINRQLGGWLQVGVIYALLVVAPLFECACRGCLCQASLLQELALEVQLLIMTHLSLLHSRVSIIEVCSLRREQFFDVGALRSVHVLQ